ncbi:hypothetical protein ML401_23525 [Bradyrhizobium sp. 62B]|uniref:hypothetical protein n=1 Tax=Bradyrhizobium sp. 62B TaxID=2898442 RepID=UPI00255804DF|nr:hypothetical protein ML401_23525 [Bradyrhizobium sp. 62B]
MGEQDAERFRLEAEECRRLAAQAAKQEDREAWLKLAADWMTLAQGADLHKGVFRLWN